MAGSPGGGAVATAAITGFRVRGDDDNGRYSWRPRGSLLVKSMHRDTIDVVCWNSELLPEFWNTVVMPVLLLIEPVVVIAPVVELPITELPRKDPSLSAPSKLKWYRR